VSDKLPQARLYLRAAKWGFDNLLSSQCCGAEFVFYMLGILTTLRAVQEVLRKKDKRLSPEHRAAIKSWERRTHDWRAIPELSFIKQSRDRAIKDGSFSAYAVQTETGAGEGKNYIVTKVEYELAYYDEHDNRFDLESKIRAAIEWYEKELADIEKLLPG
jgi:hypothetical protein